MNLIAPNVVIYYTALIIATVSSIGVTYLRSYINKRIENEQINKAMRTTINIADSVLHAVILELSSNLKLKLASGKLESSDIQYIQSKAMRKINREVPPNLLNIAASHTGNLNQFLLTRIAGKLQKIDKVTN